MRLRTVWLVVGGGFAGSLEARRQVMLFSAINLPENELLLYTYVQWTALNGG